MKKLLKMANVKKTNRKKSEDETSELKEQLARALADYDNLRKRTEREREDFGRVAKVMLIARLLPIYDMLEEAQKHLKDSGLAITIEEFTKVLKEEGIEKIDVKAGDAFNEEVHEAVEVTDLNSDGKDKEGKITEIVLSGWRLVDGVVLRHAKVKVGKKEK